MRRLVIILMMCVGCITVANAQSSFTERLQKSGLGEGKITVTQDKAIDDLINGKRESSHQQPQAPVQRRTEEAKDEKTTNPGKNTERPTVQETTQTAPLQTPDTLDTRKKLMKGYKVTGYRVQVFAGGNSRNDRLKAESIGNEIKSLFPATPVYVHFYSPRWICRIGNYRTYEEAHEVLRSVKNLGYESAIIVKGKITVQYP